MTKHTQRFRAARANTAARIRNSLGQTNMSKINHFLQTATLLFRENHRRFKILMRSRTTCCCSFSWLASGRECMISKNVNAACNTAGNWIASSIDRKWTRFFLKLKNLGILFLGSVLWARAVKKGGARPPLAAIL